MSVRLFCVAAAVLVATSARAGVDVTVSALIDGRSVIEIRNGQLWWHHLDYAAPGLLANNNVPTSVNGYAWYPQWPGFSGEVRCGGCLSTKLDLVTAGIYLGPAPRLTSMTIVSARYSATVLTTPSAANGFLTEIDLNDDPLAGGATYTVTLHYDPAGWMPVNGLVGYWPGDGDGTDHAGTNAATLNNGAGFAAGQLGQAFSFNGHAQDARIGNAASLSVAHGDFTAAAWVKFGAMCNSGGYDTGPVCDMSIVDKMTNAVAPNTDGWRLIKQTDGHFWFCFGGGGSNGCYPGGLTVISQATATTGPWTQVTAVKRGGQIELWINGAHDATQALGAFTDTGSGILRIGGQTQEGSFIIGAVDDVRLYNRALSSSEIGSLALLPPSAAPPPPAITAPANGATLVAGAVSISGTGVPGAELTLLDAVTPIASATVGTAGTFSASVTFGVGVHALTATQSTGGPSSNASAEVDVTVVPPAPSITSSPSRNPDNHAAFAGGAFVASTPTTVRVYDFGALAASVAASGGAWSFDGLAAPRKLNDGPHALGFTAVVNGFESATTSSSFVLWTQPPALAIVAPAAGSSQAAASQPISWTAAAGYAPPAGVSIAAVSYAFDGAALYSGAPAGAPTAIDLTMARPGAHIFALSATDSLGNADPAPFSSAFTYAPSLATDRALTLKLLGPIAGDCSRRHEDDDEDDDGHRFTCGNLRSLVRRLDIVRRLAALHPRDPEDKREVREEIARQLWRYITAVERYARRKLIPAAVAGVLAADVRFLLDQYGGPPRRERDD
jgi:hypothetical protein